MAAIHYFCLCTNASSHNFIGDRLLDRGVGTWTSETPQDTLISISFPGRQGSYAHVSSLVINVYQVSGKKKLLRYVLLTGMLLSVYLIKDANGSEAHIIEGGIFQVTIKILIEAYSVTNVTYDYEVFGPVY